VWPSGTSFHGVPGRAQAAAVAAPVTACSVASGLMSRKASAATHGEGYCLILYFIVVPRSAGLIRGAPVLAATQPIE
jgi:hypothetical protein